MDIYREEILEHWQNPQNWGVLKNHDLAAEVVNPLCGDRLSVQVKLDDQRLAINDVRFTGNGCAISIASASILSENIKNSKIKGLKKITGKEILKMIGGGKDFPPARLKCAFLALEAVRKLGGSLDNYGQKVQD